VVQRKQDMGTLVVEVGRYSLDLFHIGCWNWAGRRGVLAGRGREMDYME
jgi:hypothetical protein